MIFVNVAAYRDAETGPTVRDLFYKARHPDRINVQIVWQAAPDERLSLPHGRVRIRHIDAAEARGPCWARAKGYESLADEDYVLQIDSHMRFAPGWDVRLIEQLSACPSAKAILTTYPPHYEPPMLIADASPVFIAAKRFDREGILTQQGLIWSPQSSPQAAAFLAAGFVFGRSDWVREVPYDPALYFLGEEITLAARLWTSGWDLFGPAETVLWHHYATSQRARHWDDDRHWAAMNGVSVSRVRKLLGIPARQWDAEVDLSGFGLGSARTLADYERFAGVDFAAGTVTARAMAAEFR